MWFWSEYGGEVACDGRVWQLGGPCEDTKTHPLTIMPLDDPNIGTYMQSPNPPHTHGHSLSLCLSLPLSVCVCSGADGPQDVLLICVKAQYVRECLHHLEKLIGPDTVVVAAQNGIPFWLMHKGG